MHIAYGDYRLAAGVKMPFRWTVTWTDGAVDHPPRCERTSQSRRRLPSKPTPAAQPKFGDAVALSSISILFLIRLAHY